MSEDRGWEYLHSDDFDYDRDDDGSWGSEYSDGSGSYYGADGSWGTKYSDGSASYYGADGSWGTKYSDGSSSYYGADGSWGQVNSDGSGSFYGSDGEYKSFDSHDEVKEFTKDLFGEYNESAEDSYVGGVGGLASSLIDAFFAGVSSHLDSDIDGIEDDDDFDEIDSFDEDTFDEDSSKLFQEPEYGKKKKKRKRRVYPYLLVIGVLFFIFGEEIHFFLFDEFLTDVKVYIDEANLVASQSEPDYALAAGGLLIGLGVLVFVLGIVLMIRRIYKFFKGER